MFLRDDGGILDDGENTLRQRPGRPCPGCPEHFVTLEPGADRSVSEDRTEAERAQGVEELQPGINKPKAYLGGMVPDMGWPAPLDCRCTVPGRPAAVLHKAAGGLNDAGLPKRDSLIRILMPVLRAALLGRGPRKCGVLRRARAGDGPGSKLLPDAASDGRAISLTVRRW